MLDSREVSSPFSNLGNRQMWALRKPVEMNTMAVVYAVDGREEIACSYSTKLIQGFENLSSIFQRRRLLYNALPLFSVFELIRYTKTTERKQVFF